MLVLPDGNEQGCVCLPDSDRQPRGPHGLETRRDAASVSSQTRRLSHLLGERRFLPHMRIALLGGIYSNYHALTAALSDIARHGADATYFLGDLGAFGPHPDRVPELLIQ